MTKAILSSLSPIPRISARRRVPFEVATALVLLSLAMGATAAPQHPGDRKEADLLPRYEGPGHRGVPVEPGEGDGMLDMYGENVTLLSWVPLPEFEGIHANANDIWGYVAPSGREYAILGLESGTGFVDVTNPGQPTVVATVPDESSLWSDMETFDHYAYNVNEAGNGIQVIDLENIDQGQVQLLTEIHDQGTETAHNVRVDRASATLYTLGSNVAGGGLVAFDLSNPAQPQYVGSWGDHYVHDAFVTSYTDGPYAGREIAFAACGEAGLIIVDVTNKAFMNAIGALAYPTVAYCHHAWLDDSKRYLYVNDEVDEIYGYVSSTTTYIVDVQDLENPILVGSFTNGLPAIDHNPMGRGNLLFEANYRSGLRVYDITNPLQATEVAYFDSYPEDDEPYFSGAWGVFTRLPSGTILVSDMQRGLLVLEVSGAVSVGDPTTSARLDFGPAYPNPFTRHTRVAFHLDRMEWARLRVVDAGGRTVETLVDGVLAPGRHVRMWHAHDHGQQQNVRLSSGVYFAVLETDRGMATRKLTLLR